MITQTLTGGRQDTPGLISSFHTPSISTNILSRFHPVQLSRLAAVNGLFYKAIQQFRAYELNQRLAHFFNDPLSFRSLMAQTHTIISGSFALQFLDGSYYPNSDLDLYILPNDTLLVLGAYLCQQGYVYIPKEWQQEDFLEDAQHVLDTLDVIPELGEDGKKTYTIKCVRAVYTFQRHVTGDDIRQVQVVVPRISPLHCVLAFHSSEL